MKIVVLGGCGYIGSRLVPKLLGDGHEVFVADTQLFGDGDPAHNGSLTLERIDVREKSGWEWDALIHLASISNNNMYAKNRGLCESVNRWMPEFVPPIFIYASSVAAYGTSAEVLTEDSPLKPTTPYGEDKARCEEVARRIGGTVVRAASVCGPSGNMRFDTPVNRMTWDALNRGKITVNGGTQVRCHVHIDDLCDFYRLLLTTDKKIKGEAFNVVRECVPMMDTAFHVQQSLADDYLSPNAEKNKWPEIVVNVAADERSYKVSKDKAIKVLNFAASRTINSSVREMRARYDAGSPQYHEDSDARMRML